MQTLGYSELKQVRQTQLDSKRVRDAEAQAAVLMSERLGDLARAAEIILYGPLPNVRRFVVGLGPRPDWKYGADRYKTYLWSYGVDDDGLSLVGVWRDHRRASMDDPIVTLPGAFLSVLAGHDSWDGSGGPNTGESVEEIVGLARRMADAERSRAARLATEAESFAARAAALDQKRKDPTATSAKTSSEDGGVEGELADERVLQMGLALLRAIESDELPAFFKAGGQTNKKYLEWCGDQVDLSESRARELLKTARLLVPGKSGKTGAGLRDRAIDLLGQVGEERGELGDAVEHAKLRVLELLP